MSYSAFLPYYEEYRHKIFSYLYYRSGRKRQLAEDLTSEVFLKALEKFHTYTPERSFKSWIYTIAHNHLVDHYRRNKETVALDGLENVLPDDSSPERSVEQRISREETEKLLTALGDTEKEIVLLRYHHDLPMKDIAEIVEKPEATVRVIIHRALAKLRKQGMTYSNSFI